MHSVALGVIDRARERQRRRLGIVAVIAICAALTVSLIVSRSGDLWTGRASTLSVPSQVAPAAVFSQAPDMGVACHAGACDSVGLAV